MLNKLSRYDNGPCPYLPNLGWSIESFYSKNVSAEEFEKLINQGYRRSGFLYYHNICENCQQCIPLRVDVKSFTLSKSQKKIWRKNNDIKFKIIKKPKATSQLYELYRQYISKKHQINEISFDMFKDSLMEGPDYSRVINYYLGEKLVSASWIDVLPTGINSQYSAYSPDYANRSLGSYTALSEIKLAKKLKLDWYYLGFWVKDCSSMNYKSKYQPCQVLSPTSKKWERFEKHYPTST
ncbi:MAG: arginyltransferase [SAR324 cluster bacterium]|nr:arginyltransferase [SAR324 cluster bacterium]